MEDKLKVHKVYIAVLTHNSWNITEQFLQLLYANTSPEAFRLLVLDNGSTDETRNKLNEFAKDHSNVELILSDSNLGVIDGRNTQIKHFLESNSDDLFLMLDNDQFVREGWLQQHVDFLMSGYDLIGVEAWQLGRTMLPVLKLQRPGAFFHYVGCGGMLLKREVVQKVGLFDDRYNPAYFEDPDYNFRIQDAGFKIGWNDQSRITHVPHQTLGKMSQKEKNDVFVSSYHKFRAKWKDRVLQQIINPYRKISS